MWRELRGHIRQREQLAQAVRRGRLAHAYLFIGPEGIGKARFAECLAQSLLCRQRAAGTIDACGVCTGCIQVQAATHPDLIRVRLPDGKRELPIELIIGAQERRGREGLCHELSLRPMSADRRIAIVEDAHTMNTASANALLKTLEEPPPGSVLILLTPSSDAILPTIRSRCQPLMFAPLNDGEIAALIRDLGWADDDEVIRTTAALATGSLATARQLLQPELRQLRLRLFSLLDRADMDAWTASDAVLNSIDEMGGEPANQRLNASWAVRFCVESLRSRLRELSEQTTEHSANEDALQLDLLAAQLERCLDAEVHLQRSMPIPLCIEGMFDGLALIRRGTVV
ncbi:MAG: DNA polymerase III subunit delta' [Planctomycetaceae bacterium]|nr:DNA polymerase III subunit delta' [Planctomycetaceae bacterium]